MDKLQLTANVRDLEKEKVKAVRNSGLIPAELYGHNVPNVHLTVNKNEFTKVLRKAGESTIIELVGIGGKPRNVLIHDFQKHYLTSEPEHVDFYEVSMTEKLTATVALEFVGESKAVKEQGGVLVKILNEVEVECLPSDLPHNIEVDISKMTSFDISIHVKDLSVPPKVTIVTDPEETVAKVQPPRNVEAELTAPVVEDVSKVEGVVKEEPPAEEKK